MASSNTAEKNQELALTSTNTYTPKVRQALAKNKTLFPLLILGFQVLFIILLGVYADYGHEPVATTHEQPSATTVRSTTTYPNGTIVEVSHEEPTVHRGIADFYAMFQDIHVMIFVGFGFLMTFLKKYGFSAVGYNFLLAAFVLELALIVRGYMFDFNSTTRTFPIDVERIIVADFVAAAVMISLGAVLGKTNLTQLIVMAFIEVILQSINEYIGLRWFCAFDIGESMFVHVFGAYFGLAVATMLYDKKLTNSEVMEREKSVYHSDLFSMIGTLFLFCFWPSFNAGVAASGDARLRAVVNTYISIAASVLMTYVCSCLLNKEKKFDMVHIQNATLAGGVAVGTVADKIIRPAGAMTIGSIAGSLSTIGFRFLKPKLEKICAHDTCGVNNLHGMPGLLAGIFGIILAAFPAYSLYQDNLSATCFQGTSRSALMQIAYQAAALGLTVLMAVSGGSVTGILLNLPILRDEYPSSYHNDEDHWEIPGDFDSDSSVGLSSPGKLEQDEDI